METYIDYESITEIFHHAHEAGRNFLFEYEVYALLEAAAAETPPKTRFIPRGVKISDDDLVPFTGEKLVLKVISPTIVHKTEVGGVRIVARTPEAVRSGIRRMLCEIPEKYAALIRQDKHAGVEAYWNLDDGDLQARIGHDVAGIMLAQYMPPDSDAFGNELIVGLRRTREFGMVISAGLGGTDTELYAERFRKGQAIVAASTALTTGEQFFAMFKQTISYCKLAGLTRGQRRIVTDDQLIECFDVFIRKGNYFSEQNPSAPFYLDELEINPFAFTDFLMVPLDGVCKFSLPSTPRPTRPFHKIDHLLHPRRIGIIGVSATRKNFGRIIVENIQAAGFKPDDVVVIRDDCGQIDGIRCVPSLASLEAPVDLFVVCIGAEHVPALVDDIIAHDAAKSVMLIPGGIGETEDSHELAQKMVERINARHGEPGGGPVFLGANCMGVVSRPGNYDTWFIPKEKYPRQADSPYVRTALISQSGAFMLGRTSQLHNAAPAYMISMGNQTDLTLGDMLQYFSTSDEVDVIAVYAEGFQDGDGLAFVRAVRQAVQAGKDVLFYKAGRTPEGKNATSGHTASLAGDYMVCESCVRQAGAIVAHSFTEFQQLMLMASAFATVPVKGKNLAALSGAGFESVGIADSLHGDDYHMQLAQLAEGTKEQLQRLFVGHKLDSLVTVQNPLDITPSANDAVHAMAAQILLTDPHVHALIMCIMPFSPMLLTTANPADASLDMHAPEAIAQRFIALRERKNMPVVCVVDGGDAFEPLRQLLREHHIPVFSICDAAVATLSLYIEARLRAEQVRAEKNMNR